MEGTTCLLDRVSDQIKYQNAESGLSFSSEPRVFGRTSTECFEERTGSVSLPGLDTSPPCEIEPQLEGPLDESVDDEIYNFDSLADLEVPLTAKAKVEHATSELFLVARLAVRLWSYLGLGWRWTSSFFLLMAYSTILLPGFIRMGFYYFFSPQIERSVIYGRRPRNRMDLYYPETRPENSDGWPVVVFLAGGAWTIGYKAWGALLGKRLSEQGILFISLDHRNFPQGNCIDMLEDINTGVGWILRRIHVYGGDRKNVFLSGQSAGAHLAAVAMLTQIERKLKGRSLLSRGWAWDPRNLKGFIGISGAYSLPELADHLDKRGLYRGMFETIMSINGEPMLEKLSPSHMAKNLGICLGLHMPEVLLIHGKVDRSVPFTSSETFSSILSRCGVESRCKIYDQKSHTQPVIEDPLMGGKDQVTEDILSLVFRTEIEIDQPGFLPRSLVNCAAAICPF